MIEAGHGGRWFYHHGWGLDIVGTKMDSDVSGNGGIGNTIPNHKLELASASKRLFHIDSDLRPYRNLRYGDLCPEM